MSERPYDIVLFGATGFTGELTARYLADHMPEGASWALAGRSLSKLEAVRERIGAVAPAPGGQRGGGVPLLLADVEDEGSMRVLAESTRVLISTVGPYMRYGEPVVAACAAAGTDYLDLTGEPEFADTMYLRHHQTAVQSGARLVHACGFDSIPYDLGALYTVSQLPDDVPIALQGFGLMVGSYSGGTYHSLLEAMGRVKESGRAARQRNTVERNTPEGALAEGRRVQGRPGKPHREKLAGGWVIPVPTLDPQIVLRSARALDTYGPDFSYSHYLVTGGAVKTAGFLGGIGALAFMAQLGRTRRLALKLKSPGDGPSEAQRAKGYFRVRFVADVGAAGSSGPVTAADSGDTVDAEGSVEAVGPEGAEVTVESVGSAAPAGPYRLVTEVAGGDPGYGETSKMLAESALCMAFDQGLPSAGRGGQLTSAIAFGTALIDRLIAAGIEFRVVEQS